MKKNMFIFLFCLLIYNTNFGSIYTDNITVVKIETECNRNITLGLLDSNTLSNSNELSHNNKIEYLNSHFNYLNNFVNQILSRCIPSALCYLWNISKKQSQLKLTVSSYFNLNSQIKVEQFIEKTEKEKELDFICLKINSLQNWILTN